MSLNFNVNIPLDEKGFLGRECPRCEGYFKVKLGTGLQGVSTCICPYCGHKGEQNTFWTKAQVDYIQSVVANKVMDSIQSDLKKLEFKYKPRGFGIGLSLTVEGKAPPIRYYQEQQLETEALCDNCTLAYAVFGVFAFCPDCGIHNSTQIHYKNLELINKMLIMALSLDSEIAEKLIGNALEDVVSSFDGFGRELCDVYSAKASDPIRAKSISFQNLKGAQKNLFELFSIDLSQPLTADEWHLVQVGFQKRHLLSHKMGVIDDAYIRETGDSAAVSGRRVVVTGSEVATLTELIKKLSLHLVAELAHLK